MTLRIGVHPNNLHLVLAERWSDALTGINPAFVPYADGRDSADLLAGGSIDLCGTGSTPPIRAAAAGLDVVYVAASAPRPANGGIVTARDGPIHTIADLRGRRVALLDGSFHTYLLAKVLETHGLSLRHVVRAELSPAASRHALARGEVDAWVAMAPLLDRTLAAGAVRLLAPCGGAIPNRSIFWTLGRCGLDAGTTGRITRSLGELGARVAAAPDRAADLLADADPAGIDRAAWRDVVGSRDWRIGPVTEDIIAEQQEEADTLARHGDLAAPIDLRGPWRHSRGTGPDGSARALGARRTGTTTGRAASGRPPVPAPGSRA